MNKTETHNRPETFTYGIWAWDIKAIWDTLEGSSPTGLYTRIKAGAEMLPVKKWHDMFLGNNASMGLIRVDEEYAKTVDITRPIILVMAGGAKEEWGLEQDIEPMAMIIDGWHRLHKAHTDGVERLPCILLTLEEETAVRLWKTEQRVDIDTGETNNLFFPYRGR